MASTKAGCHAIDEGFPFCLLLYSSDWLFVFGSNDCFIPYILHGHAVCFEIQFRNEYESTSKKIFSTNYEPKTVNQPYTASIYVRSSSAWLRRFLSARISICLTVSAERPIFLLMVFRVRRLPPLSWYLYIRTRFS